MKNMQSDDVTEHCTLNVEDILSTYGSQFLHGRNLEQKYENFRSVSMPVNVMHGYWKEMYLLAQKVPRNKGCCNRACHHAELINNKRDWLICQKVKEKSENEFVWQTRNKIPRSIVYVPASIYLLFAFNCICSSINTFALCL